MLFYGYYVFQFSVVKHITATLQMKSSIRIVQISIFNEQKTIICKKEYRMPFIAIREPQLSKGSVFYSLHSRDR